MRVHLFELFGIFEATGAAVGGILAIEVEIPATKTGRFAVAFDFPSLAFITGDMLGSQILDALQQTTGFVRWE